MSGCGGTVGCVRGVSRSMFRGDTMLAEVAVTLDGEPEPIAGWTFWMTAKRSIDDADADAVWQLTTGAGIEITDADGGKATITVPPEVTADFPSTNTTLVYDVQVKDVVGNVFTIEIGTIVIEPDVTRSTS